MVLEPSGLGLERMRSGGLMSRDERGKFMRAVLVSSNEELCDEDQLKPPSGCSIMSLIILCAMGRKQLVTRSIELLT